MTNPAWLYNQQRKPLSSRELPGGFSYLLNASHRSKSSDTDWQRQSDRRTIPRWSCASPPAFVFLAGSASGRLPCYCTAIWIISQPPMKSKAFLRQLQRVATGLFCFDGIFPYPLTKARQMAVATRYFQNKTDGHLTVCFEGFTNVCRSNCMLIFPCRCQQLQVHQALRT